MATNEDINTTGNVPATGSPQSPATTGSGSESSDFQSTANPNTVNSDESLNVQQTGEPISGGSPLTDSSAGAYVLGAIGVIIVIGIVLLIVRIKNFSSASSGASLNSEADVPKAKPAASTAVKSSPTAKKTAAKKPTAKKKSGKSKPSRKARH